MNELSGCVIDAFGLGATLRTLSSVTGLTDVQTFMKPGKECGIKHCIYYKGRVHHSSSSTLLWFCRWVAQFWYFQLIENIKSDKSEIMESLKTNRFNPSLFSVGCFRWCGNNRFPTVKKLRLRLFNAK